jgi:hypothetical protein
VQRRVPSAAHRTHPDGSRRRFIRGDDGTDQLHTTQAFRAGFGSRVAPDRYVHRRGGGRRSLPKNVRLKPQFLDERSLEGGAVYPHYLTRMWGDCDVLRSGSVTISILCNLARARLASEGLGRTSEGYGTPFLRTSRAPKRETFGGLVAPETSRMLRRWPWRASPPAFAPCVRLLRF